MCIHPRVRVTAFHCFSYLLSLDQKEAFVSIVAWDLRMTTFDRDDPRGSAGHHGEAESRNCRVHVTRKQITRIVRFGPRRTEDSDARFPTLPVRGQEMALDSQTLRSRAGVPTLEMKHGNAG